MLLTFHKDMLSRAVIATTLNCSVHRLECQQSDTMQHDQTSPRIHSIFRGEAVEYKT